MPHLPIRRIVIHCTASPTTTTAADVDRWHKERGWSGIGYHWLVSAGGLIEAGRPEDQVGAHVYGHNTGSIGICASGNPAAGDHWDAEQRLALVQMIADRCQAHGLTSQDVLGHCELDPTGKPDCPGLNMDNVRLEVAHALGEST